MLFATIGQWKVFVAMTVAGALTGVLYGALALVRRALSAGFWLTFAADMAFGALSAVILGGMLTFANAGAARPFAFLGAAVGLFLYLVGVHRPLAALRGRPARAFRRIMRRIAKFRPIKVIFR